MKTQKMEYNAITTLAEIRAAKPCQEGWTKLLSHLGKTKADDEPLHLSVVLDSSGLDDALWCLRAKSLDRLSRHFQAWCAEQAAHHFSAERPDDTRVREQIEMLKNDGASEEDRDASRDAAWDAESDAVNDAARAAARAAAWTSACLAAWTVAWTVERAAQERQLRKMIGPA